MKFRLTDKVIIEQRGMYVWHHETHAASIVFSIKLTACVSLAKKGLANGLLHICALMYITIEMFFDYLQEFFLLVGFLLSFCLVFLSYFYGKYMHISSHLNTMGQM